MPSFGIGLGRDLVGDVVTAVEWINESDGIVIAADIPSGVQANTGCILGTAVQADATVTFTMAKPATSSATADCVPAPFIL